MKLAWLVGFTIAVGSSATVAQAQTTLVQIENAKTGTSDWTLTHPGFASGIIEGYASLTSVNRGGQIQLFVNTREPFYTMDIFRMGYYGGLGGRRMLPPIARPGIKQPAPTVDAETGLIECDWINPYVLTIPNTPDPTDWMSGVYLVKLTAGVSGTEQYIIFTVRDDARSTDLLMAQTVNTYQAYNPWGGKSLYGTIESRADTAHKAMKVSFDRPYYGDDGNGASAFFAWEFGMIQWFEREGYDISYATNVDVDVDPGLLFSHRAFLSIGHDEYWSWAMRDHVEAARDAGISLGFFSGNVSYWQVRYEASLAHSMPNRTLVGYKEFWANDPITPDYLKTNEFRYVPVNRPEDAMIGVSYITVASVPLVVEDASHWAFTDTGLENGDVLVYADGSPVLGYEIDQMGPESPPNTRRLAHSPVAPRKANFADMTVYTAPSGATVFAAGSVGWPVTIPAIAQLTRNILTEFLHPGRFVASAPIRPPLPDQFQAQDIGDVGRAGFVSSVSDGAFTINGAGHGSLTGDDALYFVYQPMSGDGEITARLTALQLFWDNRAGLMIRASLAPDATYASLLARPSGSIGVVQEGLEFVARQADGAYPDWLASVDTAQPNWLRLTRDGDTFTASTSQDGVRWAALGSVTIPMPRDVYIGLKVASAQRGVWATAMFDSVSVVSHPDTPTDCAGLALDRTAFYSGSTASDWFIAATAPSSACTWLVSSDSNWLTVGTPQLIAVGDGSFTVQTSNNTGPLRVGHFSVAGLTYQVVQEEAQSTTCSTLALDRTIFYSGALASVWLVTVTAPTSTCTWTATSDSEWLTVNSPQPMSTGNGWLTVQTSNNAGPFRVGHFTVAGMTYEVSQEEAPSSTCATVTLSQTTYYSGALASYWPVAVTTPTPTCTWAATSDSDWITVETPQPIAAGDGVLIVRTTDNNGPFRTGHFTVSGATFEVRQEGGGVDPMPATSMAHRERRGRTVDKARPLLWLSLIREQRGVGRRSVTARYANGLVLLDRAWNGARRQRAVRRRAQVELARGFSVARRQRRGPARPRADRRLRGSSRSGNVYLRLTSGVDPLQ